MELEFLIKGESSIGKSETALELIQRGHRLVADDAVEIKKLDDSILSRTSSRIIKTLYGDKRNRYNRC